MQEQRTGLDGLHPATRDEGRSPAMFRREGDFWTLSFGGSVVRAKDTNGLRYLARLLSAPHRELHALDLVQNDPDATRARKAVTERVRATLARIERIHPELGRHLRRSIRTGTYCCYEPEAPVDWDLVPVAHAPRDVPDASKIRVMLVDDHPLWRQTLRNVLEHAGFAAVVAEAATGTEAIAKAEQARPDVVLMDMELPAMRGPQATAALIARAPGAKVLVLSSHDERETVLEAVDAGADGYLVKTADAGEIAEAVRRIHEGEAVFPAPVSSMVLSAIRGRGRSEVR